MATPEESCVLKNHKNPKKKKHIEGRGETQSYVYMGWEGGPNVTWLRANESRAVCVLSVSLVRWDSVNKTYNFDRLRSVQICIESWIQNNIYVLLFVPVANRAEYENCLLEHISNDSVRIVPYDVRPQTCGERMVVGESRNAILEFVYKFKHIFKTCVVSDERIHNGAYGLNAIGDLNFNYYDEDEEVKEFREKYGYRVFSTVRKLLEIPPEKRKSNANVKALFKRMHSDFEKDFKTLMDSLEVPKKDWKSYKNKAVIFSESKPNMYRSLLNRTNLTLLGFASARRMSNHKKHNDGAIKEGDWRKKEVIAQLTMFRVGGEPGWANPIGHGWNGQQYYTKTTMCEDNVFSFDWDENPTLGDVAEMDSVSFQRLPAPGSITRSMIKVDTLKPCSLKELVKACASNSYTIERNTVKMRWTTYCEGISLNGQTNPITSDYREMAYLLRNLALACIKNNVELTPKVIKISKSLIGKLDPIDKSKDKIRGEKKFLKDDGTMTGIYEIEAIVGGPRVVKGIVQYEVKWKGFDTNTWEPEENLRSDGIGSLIDEFLDSHKLAAPVAALSKKRKNKGFMLKQLEYQLKF
jgi:hypothetical protein